VGSDLLTVLTPERDSVVLEAIDVVVHGCVFATKRAPHSPLRDLDVRRDARATWHLGMVHGSVAIPGQTDGDEVVVTTEEIAATGLDYLALGHWHSASRGRAGSTTYAYSGAPEPVALDQDRAGKVLVVTLDERNGKKSVAIDERKVGRTRFEKLELDAGGVGSQPALVDLLAARADPDLVLDVRLIGVRPDELDLQVEEVEAAVGGRFLKVRVRDRSVPALSEGAIPPPDTVLGAFIRDVEARVAELEAGGDDGAAAELRDALRLGRLLLAGEEVTL
jgi:DNA repair exonuclease SbcCD nuclease subunit